MPRKRISCCRLFLHQQQHLQMFTLLGINIVLCTDLYGLVLFLGVDPYWVKHWWYQLLYRPYRRGNTEPLYYVIAQLLWRSAKKDVIDQVNLRLFDSNYKTLNTIFKEYLMDN